MPEIQFKGKEFVYNHHLTVPYRPLIAVPEKSIPSSMDEKAGSESSENLIIQGDNLHALKALLPLYAGKVDCIFIDPPYNTGNENWCYNDNVNNPIMKEWLSTNPVNKEDMLRHDKWACMMYPRIKLLHELLSERGSLWMTLDDNEVHHARMILDDIFGNENFVANVVWQKKVSPANDAIWFSGDHDYLIVFAKDKQLWRPNRLERNEDQKSYFSNPDNDIRGDWSSATYTCNKSREERRNLYYPIINPNTEKEVWPSESAVWRFSPENHERNVRENLLYWGVDGNASMPRLKLFLFSAGNIVPRSLWPYSEVGHTQEGTLELQNIVPSHTFVSPKPTRLINRVLEIATDSNSIVLDSFAGSGTTAHAVLAQNAKDGGNRRFILVECEEYADTLTAERVRRVINGYEYQGTQKEELLREKVNFATLKKSQKLLRQIEAIEELKKGRFDKITKTIKNDELLVVGEKRITERMECLGGGFTYFTLGDPLDLDKLLTGEHLPDFAAMGAWLFHTATGEPLDPHGIRAEEWYLGESPGYHVWLIYRPDLDFMKSRDAALTLTLAEKFSATCKEKKHLVFAPARFVTNKFLHPLNVEHAPLPFALYRFEKG